MYPKIDCYYNGRYMSSTNMHKTRKGAKKSILDMYGTMFLDADLIRCEFSK